MIDMHCHLLPGIDDGPDTLEQSLALASHAVQGGIRHAVLTPHIHPGRYDNQRSSLSPLVEDFRRALSRGGIPLQISLGSEARLSPELIGLIEQDEVPMLGTEDGFQIMLLEFPHSHIVPGADKLVARLLDLGVRPMIAHPERNKAVMHSLDALDPFIEMGCLVQITAGALVGNFGPRAMERGMDMLKLDWVSVLASDAHNLKYRPPELSAGRDAAANIVGAEAALAMVTARPAGMLGLSSVADV
jgi:protein-tyrosine phosphatase